MTKRIVVFLLFVVFLSGQGKKRGYEYSNNPIIEYALQNAQQKGSFYFLPIKSSGINNDEENMEIYKDDALAQKINTLLEICSTFEKVKEMDIQGSPQIIRDQYAEGHRGANTYGIWFKALPKKK